MDVLNILMLVVSLLALLVTYAVFKSDQQPQIIAYATPHYGKPSLIQLHIRNIGKCIAHDVKISTDQPLPKAAFGISQLSDEKEVFNSGIFKYGIKVFPPNLSYTYDWGQYGGLKEALNELPLTITASYTYRHPLNLWNTKIIDISVIDIRELESMPASTGGIIDQLKNIGKELKELNSKINKNLR
jgi:hypothetical protein